MSATHRNPPVSLLALFPDAQFIGDDDILVTHATERSDLVSPGVLFAAIPGTRRNGEEFARDAVLRGSEALLLSRELPDLPVLQCIVPDVRRAYARLCDALAGRPSQILKLAGVTGTNGKTTTTWMIRSILRAAGYQTGLLGTIEYSDGARRERAGLTTPDSQVLSNWLASMVAAGTTHAAMELSSHALDQGRACGTQLDAAIVTNITQDHFDYHPDFGAYLAAKSRIVEHLKPGGVLVLNADDERCSSIARLLPAGRHLVTFGIEREADVTAPILDESKAGTRFVLGCGAEAEEVFSPLIGRYNVSNALAAAAAAHHFGVPLKTIALGLGLLGAVPGRMERVDAGQPFEVFVDFAHTEDALRRCVTNLRRICSRRIIVVFGAGGDRDRNKRPKMARAVLAADLIVVTSDNPRTEDPQRIVEDILAGFAPSFPPLHIELDRRTAISWALDQARPGDCVLIAGKGHETEQIIGTKRYPFDDCEVVREALTGAEKTLVLEGNWR
ncbi:MAG: UDP-N-acetylmuramoyl-L-alanyl-D-glutamate--2,6-diaminopimelate ligase [Planctomycetaceae bacterium]